MGSWTTFVFYSILKSQILIVLMTAFAAAGDDSKWLNILYDHFKHSGAGDSGRIHD